MPDLEKKIAEWRRQMLAAGIKTPVPLEELESHLRDDVEQQMRTGLSAHQALEAAVQRMGQADALRDEFAKGRLGKRFSHERIYSAVLAILAVYAAMTFGGLWHWHSSIGGPVGRLPAWAVLWMAAVHFAYAVCFVVTLLARRFRPESGRRLTRILNWALLPAIPCGTVLGIYGLFLVDCGQEHHA